MPSCAAEDSVSTADSGGTRPRTGSAACRGSEFQWVDSYVAGDKTFCVYLAGDEAISRLHAEVSAFPATKITEALS
jgi:hypothetical protein